MTVISLMPYILAVQVVILGVVGTWLVWHFKLRIVYKAEFYRQIDVTSLGAKKLVKVGTKEFKPDSDHVDYKGKAYAIFFEKMVSTDGRVSVWAFDIEKKHGLTFGGSHDVGDVEFAEDLLYSGFIKRLAHLVASIDMTFWLTIVLLVVVAVLAFVVGLFVSPYILPVPTPAPVGATPA